jgi:putative flippase GtrA
VSFARRIYERFQLFIHEMAKFGIVGGLAFLATEGFFNLLLHAGAGAFMANAGATLAAAIIAFLGNRYWTFRHRDRGGMGRETIVFFVLNGIGILIQQLSIEVAKYEFGRHDTFTLNAAFLFGVAVATLFRFWSYRKWVWRMAAPAQEETAVAVATAPVSSAPAVAQVDGSQLNGTEVSGSQLNGTQVNGAPVNGHELDERIVPVPAGWQRPGHG